MAKTPAPNDQTPERNDAVRPTEQLPLESAPVSARSAASGGATGLSDGTGAEYPAGADANTNADTNPSLFRRHPIASGIVAGAVAVILVAGITAWGVGTVVTASLTSSTSGMSMGAPTPTAAPTTGPTKGQAAGGARANGRLAFRATIQSMDGSSWTILTKKGQTVTVTITSSTQFGTKRMAATVSSFAVGDSVVIVATPTAGTGTGTGTSTGTGTGTATAARVVNAADLGAGTTPMPGMTATPNA